MNPGDRFGRLTVVRVVSDRFAHNSKRGSTAGVECRCDCGETTCVRPSALRAGNTRSCGCLVRERMRGNRLRIRGANSPNVVKCNNQ